MRMVLKLWNVDMIGIRLMNIKEMNIIFIGKFYNVNIESFD